MRSFLILSVLAVCLGPIVPASLHGSAGDFSVSAMGPNGFASYEARNPAAVYNGTNGEYLVVWWGDDNSGSLINDEVEIFGQRIDAATGDEAGTNDFRISDMGSDGSTQYGALYPKVAYDSN